jgi:hypothetical protein
MRKFYSLILSLIVSSIALGQATNTFNSSNGSFNTAANWSLGHTPLATENVDIPSNRTAYFTANFTISTLNMKVGGTLDLDRNTLNVTNGNIQIQSGGTITGKSNGANKGTIVYGGQTAFQGGTLNGPQYLNPSTGGQFVAGTLASNIKDFTATVVNNSVKVQWAGLANTSFSLERSGDSRSWSSVANFSDAGESRFVYNDISAISGINYYRLKSLSTDGSIDYSAIKVVHVGESKASLKVFPNPAVRSLNVYVNPGSEQRKISAILVNRTGQVVAQRVLGSSSGMLEFQVSNLPEGSYTLNIKGENGYAESRSVVISRK